MSLEVILMSLVSLVVISLCACEKKEVSLGVRLMSLGVGLEEELGDELGGDFDEFDDSQGVFAEVFLGGRLMSLGVLLLSLGMGLEQQLGDEFGVILMSLIVFVVCLLQLEMRLMSLEMALLSLVRAGTKELGHELGGDLD